MINSNAPLSNKGFYIFLIPLLMLLVAVGSSCGTIKQSSYFKTLQQKDTTIKGFVNDHFESKIIVGDKLSITVTSLSQLEDGLFNSGAGMGDIKGATASAPGYTVQADGTVLLHRLGNVQVVGYTRKELTKYLQKSLLPFLKEPIVQVNYLNHKVTILGDVNTPQVLNMPEEQISLIDALVLSGDVTINGRRDNITIIRENGNEKQVKHVNLEDHSIFTSPWYYIKPNDIILVASDEQKFIKNEKRLKLQGTLSLIASGVSLLIIVLSQVFK
jgi:polysaccharide biosynthesis/export protein